MTKETTSNGLPDWLRQVSTLVAAGLVVWAIQCSDQEAQRRGDTLGEAVGGISTKVDEISTDVTGLKTRQEAREDLPETVEALGKSVAALNATVGDLGESVKAMDALQENHEGSHREEYRDLRDLPDEAENRIGSRIDRLEEIVSARGR